MIPQHYPENQLKADILDIAKNHFDLLTTKIFIFGSRATDKGDDRSDIDLGIESNPPISLDSLQKFKEEVENLNTLYTIDVVNFNQVSSEFNKVASQKKIYLN